MSRRLGAFGRIFTAAAIVTLLLATAKRVVSRKADPTATTLNSDL
jgi:hypothetical protein